MSVIDVAKYLHSKYSGSCEINTDKRLTHTMIVNRHTGKKRTLVRLFRNEKWEEANSKTKRHFINEAKKILRIANICAE